MIGTGWVASAGAHIYLGAKRGERSPQPRHPIAERALPDR
jgi:glycogen(starch) synthase